MKSISFESLDGLLIKMCAAETIRRLRLPLISGNGSYSGFLFVFINRKDVESNS